MFSSGGRASMSASSLDGSPGLCVATMCSNCARGRVRIFRIHGTGRFWLNWLVSQAECGIDLDNTVGPFPQSLADV